jgi:hypothetical protein
VDVANADIGMNRRRFSWHPCWKYTG